MLNAILIIMAAAVYLFASFMFATFLGRLMHFCSKNDVKEGTTHDNDAQ